MKVYVYYMIAIIFVSNCTDAKDEHVCQSTQETACVSISINVCNVCNATQCNATQCNAVYGMVCTDGWMDGWMHGWMDGGMDGWMDEWMSGWMDGWMEGWIRTLYCQYVVLTVGPRPKH